jgi:uncharacterized membrane protein
MKTFRSILALNLSALALGLMAGPMVAQAQYDYLTIDYPGGVTTQVFGINNRGNVVGNGISDPDTFPFVYSPKKGTITDVAPLDGDSRTSVLGINGRGDMVGSVFEDGITRGFIRDKDGNFTVFEHPEAVSFTQARGINNDGLVTGFRDDKDDQFTAENGFIYDSETGTFTDIVPSLFTIAHGITQSGDVVGSAVFSNADDPCPPSAGQTVRYGWLRTADGAVIYFDVNGRRTSARGITESGTIAGFVSDSGTANAKGFVAELDGSPCQSITVDDDDLLAPTGAELTFLQGIKKTGEVVGWYSDENSVVHGFIATPQ